MTRELSPKAGAALLRTTFAAKGTPITQTEALDLVAKLKGYNAWSHLQQDRSKNAAPPLTLVPGPTSAPKARTAPNSRYISLCEVLEQHYGHGGELALFPRTAWEEAGTPGNYWSWVAVHVDEAGYSWGHTPFTFNRNKTVKVTLPNGAASAWNMEVNLTCRWGELNNYMPETKPGLAILTLDEPLFEGLVSQMYDETTFIGRKDGEFGVYYELEFCSQESEESDRDDNHLQYRPHAEVVAYLLENLVKLQAQYPKVEFCIPNASEIVHDRAGVWAFVKSGSLNDAERKDLGTALFAL